MRTDEHWVFGYGSLMWRPGFSYLDRAKATIRGYHRSLCVYSHVHRGTPERPGLVLGLDRGGACCGVAFRIEPGRWQETVAYLREREQTTGVYLETRVMAKLEDGTPVSALVYVIDRRHFQYAGRLPVPAMAEIVRGARGKSGVNIEYVVNTSAHLDEMGIEDRTLADLCRLLRGDAGGEG